MQRDKHIRDRPMLFSFSNSINNSRKPSPDSSANVSFQAPFSTALKSYHTQASTLSIESPYAQLCQSSNKENEAFKRGRLSGMKPNAMGKKKQSLGRKSSSRDKSTKVLAEKSINQLPNFQFNLAPSLTASESHKSILTKSNSEQKTCSSSKREQNIKVFVRLKPKIPKEKAIVDQLDQKTIRLDDNYFCFDEIFSQQTGQQTIFETVGQQMCQQLFEGYNGTIFAYGQTGSGKTFTIFGQESQKNYGLIYRCIRQILSMKDQVGGQTKVRCSMLELYKEQMLDMLGGSRDLKLKERKGGEVYVEGLKEVYVQNEKEMMRLVQEGAKGRKVSSTRLNEESSRSHTLLTIHLERENYSTKLCLIDLAGSQKVSKSGTQGLSFEQTKKINYSLSCLGNVINALTTRKKSEHIPFRDSKLTRLLKDSLTGNFLTSIIVNVAVSEQFSSETLSSLKFAERAKKIKVNVESLEEQLREKETITRLHSIIRRLKSDLDQTTNQLKMYKEKQMVNSHVPSEPVPSRKRIFIHLNNSLAQKQAHAQEERGQSCQSEMTGRNPIPSERAQVDQNLKRYRERGQLKVSTMANALFLPEFSSLNVSKSIRRFDTSPDISSLELKCDQSPDNSLSFSIQGETALRQAFLNSPK